MGVVALIASDWLPLLPAPAPDWLVLSLARPAVTLAASDWPTDTLTAAGPLAAVTEAMVSARNYLK